VPEGDVLFRTAAVLQRWLGGREVTAATTVVPGLAVAGLVGRRVASVEAWGKHLLIRFDEVGQRPGPEDATEPSPQGRDRTSVADGIVLHTHLRMSGSWHVYLVGDPWRRPSRQGPDVLDDPVDLDSIRVRARARPPETALGELLLDQRVLAGIGNIYRCEALFLRWLNPWTPLSGIDDADLDALVTAASDLMRANLGPMQGGPSHERRWVYRRSGRPCRRCGTLVRSRRQGEQARTAYWCPTCQPAAPAEPPGR